MNKREQAKETLVHYMRGIADKAGFCLDGDCITEIEGIVDDIISASVQAVKGSGRNERRL